MESESHMEDALTPAAAEAARLDFAKQYGAQAFTPSAEPARPLVRGPEIVKSFAPLEPEVESKMDRTMTGEEQRRAQEEYRRSQDQGV